jgi:putative nucleotidyltransferase with HDIG domain
MSVLHRVQPILTHRLAALFHDVAKPQTRCVVNGKIHFFSHEYRGASIVTEILKEMKYSNSVIDAVVLGVKNHMRFKQNDNKCPSDKVIRKFMDDMGNNDNMALVLDVINADNASHAIGYCMLDQVNQILNKIVELKDKENDVKAQLPINGNDIMEKFGLKKGPRIGYLLDVAKDAYFENPNITKEECFKEIEKVIHLDII